MRHLENKTKFGINKPQPTCFKEDLDDLTNFIKNSDICIKLIGAIYLVGTLVLINYFSQ